MEVQYDREADALYIRLRDAAVARTVEADDFRIIDLDAEGRTVGLEILNPHENLAIAEIARDFGFDSRLNEIDECLRQELGLTGPAVWLPFTATTMLVGPPLQAEWPEACPSSGNATQEHLRVDLTIA